MSSLGRILGEGLANVAANQKNLSLKLRKRALRPFPFNFNSCHDPVCGKQLCRLGKLDPLNPPDFLQPDITCHFSPLLSLA